MTINKTTGISVLYNHKKMNWTNSLRGYIEADLSLVKPPGDDVVGQHFDFNVMRS